MNKFKATLSRLIMAAEGRRRINAQISLDVYICGVKRDKNVHV